MIIAETKPAIHRIAVLAVALVVLVLVGRAMGQDIKKVADVVAGGPEGPSSLLDLTIKGGPVMIPIGLCSVLAVGFALERLISLRRKKIMPEDFLPGLKEVFNGADDSDKGVEFCQARPCAISSVLKAGIDRLAQGVGAIEKAVEDAGAREVDKMKRSLRPLSVIATISPLLGLLGTVYGMIGAFQSASAMGVGKADTLATGIYEALVTTAAGLTLAIPVLVVYQIFCAHVDKLVDRMDDQALDFLEYAAYGKGAPRAVAVPASE
ncbi:MAG: MotA/TolQ/ExbB proton channel family protein [Phycisphaerae bacterium]|nr:MotA/TolQ/ExbB proton channel family protein [Phycisphaerae bacterium]